LDWAGAIQDIQGAVNYLKSMGCESIGVIGFCMGGALSLRSSGLVSGLSACAFFYGIPGGFDVSQIKIPIQVFIFFVLI
jgi:carboxymethylenebutenolidase